GDFAAALAEYEVLIATSPEASESRLYVDAAFRRAVVLGALERWWEAVAMFDHLLQFERLEPFDELEALVGHGVALQEAGDPDSAEIALGHALRFYREASEHVRFTDHGLVAETAFRMGMIASDKYEDVRLALTVEVLRQRLQVKCELLLSAQS